MHCGTVFSLPQCCIVCKHWGFSNSTQKKQKLIVIYLAKAKDHMSTPCPCWLSACPVHVQYWSIKCRAMDLVLFVRHGSFYNLFDSDADLGMRVGLNISGR